MKKWNYRGKLSRTGHKLFSTIPRYAIADDSGRTPEDTDDGVLFIDFDRYFRVVDHRHGAIIVSMPLLTPWGEKTKTLITWQEFMELEAKVGHEIGVRLDEQMLSALRKQRKERTEEKDEQSE